jgi:hypothetical protein
MSAKTRRSVVAAVGLAGLLWYVPDAHAVPMWSRRYGVSCSVCHSFPSHQLTAQGLDFLRRGHRLEDDGTAKQLTDVLSGHGQWDYTIQKDADNPFPSPEFHLHAGGAINSHFSFYTDANINEDFESNYVQFTQSEGKDSYFTARAGKISPTIIRNYANGLMSSISTPLIITDTTLDPNPFAPARDSFGVNIAERYKALFFEAGVVNGEDVPGQAAVANHKDVYATGELNLPGELTGVGLYYYRGGYDLGDPSTSLVFDGYDREAVFANFTRDRFRLSGAYLIGKDHVDTLADRKISGYYGQGDVMFGDVALLFVRYDHARTEDETGINHVSQVTAGTGFKFYQSEASVACTEVELSRRKVGEEKTDGILVDLMWSF